jgi:predicted DNA-binding transcriptional regulator AlpA
MPRKKQSTPAPNILNRIAAARAETESGDVRLLSRGEVLAKVPVSYVSLFCWMRDGKFPKSRQVGGRVCWIETEVNDWIKNLPVTTFKDSSEKVA